MPAPPRPQPSTNTRGGVPPQLRPIAFPRLPDAPSRQVLDPPSQVPQDGPAATRPQHEIVQVLIEGQEPERRQQQGHQAHAAERHAGNQHHPGQPDPVARGLGAAAGQVLRQAPVDAIGNPFQIGVFGRKIGDHPQRQFREKGAHALDQAAVQLVGAAGECDLDSRLQVRSTDGGAAACRHSRGYPRVPAPGARRPWRRG